MHIQRLLNLVGNRLHTLPIVVLYLTDGCNSRCVTCDIWRNPRRDMDMGMVEDLARAFGELDVRWAVLSGGEAMQHPHWPQIAQRLRAEGTHVMLLTNGLLVKKQIDAVLASVDELIVSLDAGTRETYRAIRGVDGFDLVLDGIRAARAGGLPVTTRTTVQRANFRELPQLIAAAKAVDVNSISFLAVDVSSVDAFGPRFQADPALNVMNNGDDPLATALQVDDLADFAAVLDTIETRFANDFASGRIAESPEKLRRLVDYFGGVLGQAPFPRPRCNAPHTSVVIEVDGTLRPCYFLPSWGKLDERGLGAAINDRGAQALRQAYRAGQRPECARCVCPLYKGPRDLLKM